jgi:hypothetical protein
MARMSHRIGGALSVFALLCGSGACGGASGQGTGGAEPVASGTGGVELTTTTAGGLIGSGGEVSVGGGAGGLSDSFDGTGPLIGYVTNNPNALPDVGRVEGRYRANLIDNTNDVTLHYHQAQGRLDAKLVTFPFEVIARNIGIGTQGNSQTAPAPVPNNYVFAGVQVHVAELSEPTSAHVVVGHRGDTHFTIEGKTTRNGQSSVNDDGANVLPLGRADIRIVGHADRTLSVQWQAPNPAPGVTADAWKPYRGTGKLPGDPQPTFGDSVYVGLITYAYGQAGIPFVGTCDALEAP